MERLKTVETYVIFWPRCATGMSTCVVERLIKGKLSEKQATQKQFLNLDLKLFKAILFQAWRIKYEKYCNGFNVIASFGLGSLGFSGLHAYLCIRLTSG